MRQIEKYISEFFGTLILLLSIVGSGIMGQKLSQNEGIILLANSLAIGFTLVFLIITFGKRSGAHFNPAVTLVMLLLNKIKKNEAFFYVIMQLTGACVGVILANIIFDLNAITLSSKHREGFQLNLSELISTFGLILIIILNQNKQIEVIGALVGLYIAAAIWFMSSTAFANPAVSLARMLTDTFTGIHYSSVFPFVVSQFVGALLSLVILKKIYKV